MGTSQPDATEVKSQRLEHICRFSFPHRKFSRHKFEHFLSHVLIQADNLEAMKWNFFR